MSKVLISLFVVFAVQARAWGAHDLKKISQQYYQMHTFGDLIEKTAYTKKEREWMSEKLKAIKGDPLPTLGIKDEELVIKGQPEMRMAFAGKPGEMVINKRPVSCRRQTLQGCFEKIMGVLTTKSAGLFIDRASAADNGDLRAGLYLGAVGVLLNHLSGLADAPACDEQMRLIGKYLRNIPGQLLRVCTDPNADAKFLIGKTMIENRVISQDGGFTVETYDAHSEPAIWKESKTYFFRDSTYLDKYTIANGGGMKTLVSPKDEAELRRAEKAALGYNDLLDYMRDNLTCAKCGDDLVAAFVGTEGGQPRRPQTSERAGKQ